MKRKYAAIVLGLTMTLTTANISAVNIMAGLPLPVPRKRNKQNQRIQTAASQKKRINPILIIRKMEMKNNQKEKPLTERNRMVNRLKSRKGRSRMADRELRESRAMVWKAMRR